MLYERNLKDFGLEEDNRGLSGPKFRLGVVAATANFISKAEELGLDPDETIKTALGRHAIGDWGNCCQEDSKENDRSLEQGDRLLSVYAMENIKFWVITERDRSVTTILLPEDY